MFGLGLLLSNCMRISVMYFLIFNLLWSTAAFAAPNDTVSVPVESQTQTPPTPSLEEEERARAMDITVPSSDKKTLNEMAKNITSQSYYYPFRQSVSPRLGLVFDPDKIRNNFEFVFLFGVMYMLPSDSNKHWEIGFDIHTGGLGYLQVNHRWVFTHTEKLRPFVRAGLSSRLKSEQGLASVVNKDNVQARVGLGIEDMIISPMSASIAMEIATGTDQSFLGIIIGYSWAW